jgi:anti-sigma-K factor RskA
LISTIPSFFKSAKYPKQSSTQIVSILPWLGWAAAACLIVMFNLPMQKEVTETPLSVSQKLETLIASYPNTQRLAFDPASPSYSEVSGEVIWNDERQEGYMSLASLPVNNPTQNQYQLWIVDPERDELPVDGGVFDIPSGTGPSIIPIRNALPINKPVAFVITLEQPGGVVKSKQEVVVALAKS